MRQGSGRKVGDIDGGRSGAFALSIAASLGIMGPVLAAEPNPAETPTSLLGGLVANPTLLVAVAIGGAGLYYWRKRRLVLEEGVALAGVPTTAAAPTARAARAPRSTPRPDPGVDAPAGDSIAEVLAATPAVSRPARRQRDMDTRRSHREAMDEQVSAERAPHYADRLLEREVAGRDGALVVHAVSLARGVAAGPAALDFARRLARGGRAIFIDVEGETLPEAPGLAELVGGAVGFAEAIRRDDYSRLHVIARGEDPLEEGDSCDLVIDALRETYDFVVLAGDAADDGTLVAAVEEADCVVLVRGPETTEPRVRAATRDLRAAGVADVFVVEAEMETEEELESA